MKNSYNLDLKAGVDFMVKRQHWLPEKIGVECIAFGRTLYVRSSDDRIPKHEFLHIAQFHKYGIAHVVLHYLFHVARNYRRFRNFRDAFREIPFEKEARDFEAGVFQE
jgi:hypothetical protein